MNEKTKSGSWQEGRERETRQELWSRFKAEFGSAARFGSEDGTLKIRGFAPQEAY